jgi:uncharacterized membrane protein YdjX (TVP38/TMEM64 family)
VKKFVRMAVALLVFFTCSFLLFEAMGWLAPTALTRWLEAVSAQPGGRCWVAGVVFVLLAADLILPVPSSLVMTLAGTYLGWRLGAWVAFAGAMTGALLGYGLCRYLGGNFFKKLWRDQKEADQIRWFMDTYGVWAILFSRAVPMVTEIMSCMAGFSRFDFWKFFWPSVLGTLPLCMIYAWAGEKVVAAGQWMVVGGLTFLLPVAVFTVWWCRQRVHHKTAN